MKITNARLECGICTIELRDGLITDVRPGVEAGADLDAGGNSVLPGLIDLHFHGAMGVDALDGNLEPLCRWQAERGITGFLPTLSTAPMEQMARVASAPKPKNGAEILGFHLEGPFLAPAKKGAQNGDWIRLPDLAALSQVPDVKMLTLAPELPGAMELIQNCDCVVSLGHTACDYETAVAAIEAGANCLTHTFNAMPPMLHRDPGPIGAAVEKGIYAQLICDGFHVHRAAVLAAYRMFGPEKLVLISDCIAPAGLPEGKAVSGGLTVEIRNGELRLEDGTIAGSCASLWDCMEQAVAFGIPYWDAVTMATKTPAKLMGLNKGQIAPGFDADLVITDGQGRPATVIIGGNIFSV